MFNFLQRAPKASPAIVVEPEPAGPPPESAAASAANGHAHAAASSDETGSGTFENKTSADFTPLAGVFGQEAARKAVALIGKSKPREMFFVMAPRTQGHANALAGLLSEQAAALPKAVALAAVSGFDADKVLEILRLPSADAKALADGVAEAVEMLSVTIPAAFESDSYKVARMSLDEELRSGHDSAIDALKRRALAQNIGLLRTPLGYAVAPMHEGRVVAPDVFKVLPEGLKAGVEAKLTAFEAELSNVLDNRATLQQDHRGRMRDLDREVAHLAVRASLASLNKRFASSPSIAAWLDALSADLTRNAALFVSAARKCDGHARAPVEIAQDQALARYRVRLLTPLSDPAAVVEPGILDRASLCGVVHLPPPGGALAPYAVAPGAFSLANGGLLVVDARELMAEFGAWPLVKQVLATGSARLADAAAPANRVAVVAIPVDARLVVTGDRDDYRAFCSAGQDGTRTVRLITAFQAAIPLTRDIENEFAGRVSAIVASENLQPASGAAIAALMHDRTETASGAPLLSTDHDVVRDILILANGHAFESGRDVIQAEDILAASKLRADEGDLREPRAAADAAP